MRFFLPYAVSTGDGLSLFKALPSGALRKLWEWPHCDVTVTVRRKDHKVTALIDYREGRVYCVEDNGVRDVGVYESTETESGVAMLREGKILVWTAPYSRIPLSYCIDCETREEKGKIPLAIYTKTVAVDVGHVVVGGWEVSGGRCVSHGICLDRERLLAAIPENIGQVFSPASWMFQWGYLGKLSHHHACFVLSFNSAWKVSWDTHLYVAPVETFAVVERWGKFVQIAIRYTRHGVLWLLYRGGEKTPYWSGALSISANQALIDRDAIFVSCNAYDTDKCFVFTYQGNVVGVGKEQSPYVSTMQRISELCAAIRDGKRPFPIGSTEEDPLWACALVSDDKEYVERCASASWIPPCVLVERKYPNREARRSSKIGG